MEFKGFHGDGNWYKGNIHCHTTVSDGHLTPSQVLALYKSNGYHFLAISDHDTYSDYGSEFNDENFIVLPATETAAILLDQPGSSYNVKTHHVHGILGPKAVQEKAAQPPFKHMDKLMPKFYEGTWDGAAEAQAQVDTLVDHGCIAMYNHPVWSRVREQEFVDTKDIFALEIYNYGTEMESATGYDTAHWDVMLREGRRVFGVASDDNHNTEFVEDSCGGFIVVKAPELTHEAITTAMMEGNFYSSSGPEIYDWGVRDNVAYVSCSPVERVNFIAGNYVGAGATVIRENPDEVMDYALLRLRGDETYVRVECVDDQGRTAWSNPIFLK